MCVLVVIWAAVVVVHPHLHEAPFKGHHVHCTSSASVTSRTYLAHHELESVVITTIIIIIIIIIISIIIIIITIIIIIIIIYYYHYYQ